MSDHEALRQSEGAIDAFHDQHDPWGADILDSWIGFGDGITPDQDDLLRIAEKVRAALMAIPEVVAADVQLQWVRS